jgi:hypothetical protein
LSKCKFADLKIDFFDCNQAKDYLEKSLKEHVQDKESIVKRVLESEVKHVFSYFPYSLNFIVNYTNTSSFDCLSEICDIYPNIYQ